MNHDKKSFRYREWAKMLPFAKPYKKYFIITMTINLFLASVDILIPLFQSYAIDHFIVAKTLDGIEKFALLYAAMIVGQTILVYRSVRAATHIEMKFGRDLRKALFAHLQELSLSYYNTTPVGRIHARVMSDTDRITHVVAWVLVDMLWSFVYIVGVYVIMFVLNAKLAMILLVIVPLIAVATVFFQNLILQWNRRIREINATITGGYNEGITGIKTTKTMVLEKQNLNEFQSRTSKMFDAGVRAERLTAIYTPTILLFSSLATAYVLARGGYLVEDQLMKLGTFSVFISYAVIIFEPIQQLARHLAEIIACQANIEFVTELLGLEPEIRDSEEVVAKYGTTNHPHYENWEPIKGDIEFRDVTFHYPDGTENILEHFNLTIPAGSNVAIVGETGAGKSTLVNLACRFFEPTEGQILIDGVDYRERSQLWLHSQIGYVLQNPHLFSGTIRENIRYGKLDATDEEIQAAAKAVSADKVVEKLPQGYDSEVGEGGENLSTGEKQLLSFARAILANPSIFVLDEATSSIDTQTEQYIQQATERLLQGHTSFVIAHRLSTIRKADLILVVQDGKIIEQGRHFDLLRQKGYYYQLYSRQFEEEAMINAMDN